MTELYIFSQDDDLLTIITEDTGLVDTHYRIEVNNVPDTPFSFTVEADSDNAEFVKEENKAVYRDHEGDLRLVVIRELDDSDSMEGPLTTATCEPEFMELAENIIVDRRFIEKTAQEALDGALADTRYIGEVEVDLGLATTNFYYINSIEAIWNIIATWGGEFKDVVEFNEENNIIARKVKIIQRLGADIGQRFEIDHNITEIGRTVLSYPLTAMYGRGSSLQIEDDAGEHTGGYTRYIDFAEVEWKKGVNGAPVDKPKGQKWVGDLESLKRYGRIKYGKSEDNLVRNEGLIKGTDYHLGDVGLTTGDLKEGEMVTLTFQADLGSDRDGIFAFNSDGAGASRLYQFRKNENGFYTATFPWIENEKNHSLRFYHYHSSATSESEIKNVRLIRGESIDEILHRYGIFSNQDYEDPEELLWATWQNLQENKQPEVNYRLSVDLFDDKVSLGDTAIAIDRYFSRPIEIQARIIAMEYDLIDIDGTMVVEMGQLLNLDDDRINDLERDVEKLKNQRPSNRVTEDSYPDIKPGTPVNVEAYGGMEVIQLYWDYLDEIYIKHYEVYGSQVADFIPDSQHLLYRGRVSAFAHAVNTDETWYYYIRAVNYHGTAGDWSSRADASTHRVLSDDILFGEELADRLRELSETAQIIADGTVDFSHFDNSIIEGNRFRGDLIAVDGTSYIAEGVIGKAAIADGAIERFHLGRGIIGEAQIEDLAVTDAKIADLNADKLSAGAIRGIDIYGAKFRSSSGTDWMEIVGGNMHLDQANGRYVNVNPDGLFGYNASGSLRFQANSTLVTSSAFGTSNANVYLAAQSGYEARVVDMAGIPGSGGVNDYSYLALRASGIYANFININAAHSGDGLPVRNLYLRPLSDGEVRATLNGTTDIYQPIRAESVKANVFEVNSLSGSSNHLYIRSRVDGEIRATVSGTTDNYVAFRGSGFYGSFIDRGTATGVHLYARPAGGGELKVTVRGTTDAYLPVRASNYYAENAYFYGQGGNSIFVRSDYIGSASAYSRTVTNAANLHVNTSGVLGRSTSTRKNKLVEEELSLEYSKRILSLKPKTWFDRRAAEDWAHTLSTGEETEIQRVERIAGMIAEDVQDAGLDSHLIFDDDGILQTYSPILWTTLIPIVDEHESKIKWLETENQMLRNELKIVKNKVHRLEEMVA